MLYALCGPSGAGKSTLLETVVARRKHLSRLVTVTTRERRPLEQEGRDYSFVTEEQFQQEVLSGEIVCPLVYRRARYGTRRAALLRCQSIDQIGILHPAMLNSLAHFTPIVGIFVQREPSVQPISADDMGIIAARYRCERALCNVSGSLEQSVLDLLTLLPKEPVLCRS